jgi:uncharacterized protein YkwD
MGMGFPITVVMAMLPRTIAAGGLMFPGNLPSATAVAVAPSGNNRKQMKPSLLLCLLLAICSGPVPAHAESPADMISSYRVRNGEGRVVMDSTLTRIAHEQAAAMAAKDRLDHDVLGGFNSRVNSAGAGRAAENIAYGYDSFPKTLNQWIDSAGHRKNLLLHGASRVGIASVKSATTGRTYWAMEIAGDYERPKLNRAAKQVAVAKPKPRAKEACRLKILSICL